MRAFGCHLLLFCIHLKSNEREKACCSFTAAPSQMRGSCWIYMPIPFHYELKWLFWMRWMLFHHHGTSVHVQTYLGKFALPAHSPMTSTWNGNIYITWSWLKDYVHFHEFITNTLPKYIHTLCQALSYQNGYLRTLYGNMIYSDFRVKCETNNLQPDYTVQIHMYIYIWIINRIKK